MEKSFSQWKHGRKRFYSESVRFVYFCKLRGAVNKEKYHVNYKATKTELEESSLSLQK